MRPLVISKTKEGVFKSKFYAIGCGESRNFFGLHGDVDTFEKVRSGLGEPHKYDTPLIETPDSTITAIYSFQGAELSVVYMKKDQEIQTIFYCDPQILNP